MHLRYPTLPLGWSPSLDDHSPIHSHVQIPPGKSLSLETYMTLSEVLPSIRQLSIIEKLKLIRILAEDLESAEDISPLEPFKTYNLPTPYNNFEAGTVLMQALESEDQA
jgi:hypothetical protein